MEEITKEMVLDLEEEAEHEKGVTTTAPATKKCKKEEHQY